ncbi:MAG: hypothetical protein ACLSTO_10145 [Bilophila wadsworthia]
MSFDSRVACLKRPAPGSRGRAPPVQDVAAFAGVFGDGQGVHGGNLDWTKSMNDLLADGQRQSLAACWS